MFVAVVLSIVRDTFVLFLQASHIEPHEILGKKSDFSGYEIKGEVERTIARQIAGQHHFKHRVTNESR